APGGGGGRRRPERPPAPDGQLRARADRGGDSEGGRGEDAGGGGAGDHVSGVAEEDEEVGDVGGSGASALERAGLSRRMTDARQRIASPSPKDEFDRGRSARATSCGFCNRRET